MPTAPTLPLHPQGYLSVATNLGIKDTTLDFTVIYSTVRAAAAGTFTQSLFCGAPVIVGRERLADGYAQALVINSKNANVATGQRGKYSCVPPASLASNCLWKNSGRRSRVTSGRNCVRTSSDWQRRRS